MRGAHAAAFLLGVGVALALSAPAAQASPYPLLLICDPSKGLATGFVAIDSETGETDGSDPEPCALGVLTSESASADAVGAVRHALRAGARLGTQLAELETELELEVDAGASGSLSAVASVAFMVSSSQGSTPRLQVQIAREGVPGTVLSARVEDAWGGVVTYDLSTTPAGAWFLDVPDEDFYVVLEAAAALSAAGRSRQTLSAVVWAPEPAAPLLAAVAALALAGRWLRGRRAGADGARDSG